MQLRLRSVGRGHVNRELSSRRETDEEEGGECLEMHCEDV